MAIEHGRIGRRQTLMGLGVAGVAAAAPTIGAAQTKVAPITVVINQSPWFDSFRKTVELYEKETGNKVELDVNPFAGSLEKQRNSVRAAQGQYDLLIMNGGWFAEMYFGGFVEPISDIDPAFKLDGDIYTLDNTVYFDAAKKTMTPTGKLMSVPIAPLIPLTYYRGDLYKDAGLEVPETFALLGCMPIGRQTRTGKLTVRRKTVAKRLRKKLQEIKQPGESGCTGPSGSLGHGASVG